MALIPVNGLTTNIRSGPDVDQCHTRLVQDRN